MAKRLSNKLILMELEDLKRDINSKKTQWTNKINKLNSRFFKVKCPKCKSTYVEETKLICIITDSYRELWCRHCNYRWGEGNKALKYRRL